MAQFPLPPPPQAAGSKPPPGNRPEPNKTGPILSLAGAGGVILGSFLPWVTVTSGFGNVSASGTSGDGVITLVLGGVIVVLAALELGQGSHTKTATLIVSLLGVALGIFEMFTVADRLGDVPSEFVHASIGVGLFAVTGGAGLALFGSTLNR